MIHREWYDSAEDKGTKPSDRVGKEEVSNYFRRKYFSWMQVGILHRVKGKESQVKEIMTMDKCKRDMSQHVTSAAYKRFGIMRVQHISKD